MIPEDEEDQHMDPDRLDEDSPEYAEWLTQLREDERTDWALEERFIEREW